MAKASYFKSKAICPKGTSFPALKMLLLVEDNISISIELSKRERILELQTEGAACVKSP